jgi:Sjoegren syndrome nuclear autoantigen 1
MLETIKENREEVQTEIDAEESEKKQIEETMRQLSARLQEINESLSKKYNTRNEFDKTIAETENAFMKILESSQTLLHVLKKEGASLNKKKA